VSHPFFLTHPRGLHARYDGSATPILVLSCHNLLLAGFYNVVVIVAFSFIAQRVNGNIFIGNRCSSHVTLFLAYPRIPFAGTCFSAVSNWPSPFFRSFLLRSDRCRVLPPFIPFVAHAAVPPSSVVLFLASYTEGTLYSTSFTVDRSARLLTAVFFCPPPARLKAIVLDDTLSN